MKISLSLFYSIIFFISITVSLVILLFALLFVCNIEFLILPNVTLDIYCFLSAFFHISPNENIAVSVTLFIFEHLYFSIPILLLMSLMFFCQERIKKHKYLIIIIPLINSCIYYCFITYFFSNNIHNTNKLLISSIINFIVCFIIYFYLNVWNRNNILIKIIILIPIINLLLIPKKCIDLFNHRNNKKFFYSVLIILMFYGINCFLIINTIVCFLYFNMFNMSLGISGLHVNTSINKLCYIKDELTNCFSLDYAEEILINKEKSELYYFNKKPGIDFKFVVLDSITFNLKREKVIPIPSSLNNLENLPCAKISFDNKSKTIAICFEQYSYIYILDMDTLDIIKKIKVPKFLDSLIFNIENNSYIVSFWNMYTPYFLAFPLNQKAYKKVKAPLCQGEFVYSNRNKEIYAAYHIKGEIYVYDATTYKVKRKIKVGFSVKNLYYDEKYNILIASQYFNGNVYIFLMDGTDKLIYKKFVGFFLEKPVLYKNTIYFPTHYNLIEHNIEKILKTIS